LSDAELQSKMGKAESAWLFGFEKGIKEYFDISTCKCFME